MIRAIQEVPVLGRLSSDTNNGGGPWVTILEKNRMRRSRMTWAAVGRSARALVAATSERFRWLR
eukprot:9326212-Lingulodinium_polyedra.AAC.1